MKLGIMQPYFFPYIGYFQLMAAVDRWISFDDIQFIDKGWVNRNRILHPDVNKEWQYITLPLEKRGRFDKICEISIKSDAKWREQMLGKLSSYKRKAPNYKSTIDFVTSCFDTDETNLSRFLTRTLRMTAEYLGIETPIEVQSQMNLTLNEVEHSGQWALRISEKLGATEYINPHSGADIFKEREFDASCIKLTFLKPHLELYAQRQDYFIEGLSIIDVMMWNDREKISEMLTRGFEMIRAGELSTL
jgi:hypothetical protein